MYYAETRKALVVKLLRKQGWAKDIDPHTNREWLVKRPYWLLLKLDEMQLHYEMEGARYQICSIPYGRRQSQTLKREMEKFERSRKWISTNSDS